MLMKCFSAVQGVACLSFENPGIEREHLQIHGGVSGGCSHGGDLPPLRCSILYDVVYERVPFVLLVRGPPGGSASSPSSSSSSSRSSTGGWGSGFLGVGLQMVQFLGFVIF